jgi:hypothetical protein
MIIAKHFLKYLMIFHLNNTLLLLLFTLYYSITVFHFLLHTHSYNFLFSIG